MCHARYLSLFCLVVAACTSTQSSRRGELVIVGGGLRENNAEVFAAFLDGSGPNIVVLPTASGVPDQSGPGTAEDLRAHLEDTQEVAVVRIDAGTPERAADAEYVAPLESADAIWFTGGVQSRITQVFRPDGVDARGYEAVRGVLDRGGRIGGSSAGAAVMCDPMIAWGNSREALLCGVRDVEDRAMKLEQGMGFFPFGLVDQHFLRRGRLGRLVVALEHTGERFGFGVADNRALAVDLATARGRALGDRAVLFVDASSAQREGFDRRGLRISLLSSGDGVDFERGVVSPDPDKLPVEPLPRRDRQPPELEPWGRDTVTHLLERLANQPDREHAARGDAFALIVRADERTRILARDVALADLTVIDARLRIEATEAAQRIAAEITAEIEGELPESDL